MHLQSVVIAALAAVVAASGRPCSRRGTYDCSGAEGKSGVMVCNNSSEWEFVYACPSGTDCVLMLSGGYPKCLQRLH